MVFLNPRFGMRRISGQSAALAVEQPAEAGALTGAVVAAARRLAEAGSRSRVRRGPSSGSSRPP